MALSPRKKLCSVCLQSFPESDVVSRAGRDVCPACAALAPPGSAAAAPSSAGSSSDSFNVGSRFGAELFRCLAENDLERFGDLVLSLEEAPLAFGPAAASDHGALVRGRFERDFKSKRSLYFKEGPFELVKFHIGPVEETRKEAVRYGRSTLLFRAGTQERRLTIQHLYRVRGRFKLEFLE